MCGPGPYMEVVESGLGRRGIDPARLFIERFELPDEPPVASERSQTETLVIRLGGRKHKLAYQRGDTLLDAVRRAGLEPPFACEAGSCGTCMAHLEQGKAVMRVNNALSAEEVEEGWILTCQALPLSPVVGVDYDR